MAVTADGRLRAAEWEVLAIPDHAEAVAFVVACHYARGAPNTSTYRHGLYRRDCDLGPLRGPLEGVALWIPPTRAAAESVAAEKWGGGGVLCLSRLAVAPGAPKNAASFLLAASMRAVDRDRWPVLVTYADRRLGHTGAVYLAANWTYVGDVAAGDTWTGPDGRQRGRKRGGRTLTAAAMEAAGMVRNPAAKKAKFVHVDRRRLARWLPAGRDRPPIPR